MKRFKSILSNTSLLTGNRPEYLLIMFSIIAFGKTIFFGFSPLDDTMLIASRIDWLKDIHNIISILTKPLYIGVGEFYYRPILILSFHFL